MSGLRVSALVSLEWEWYDSKENIWRIPPDTTGLKRKRDRGVEHLVPVTPEMKKLMNYTQVQRQWQFFKLKVQVCGRHLPN